MNLIHQSEDSIENELPIRREFYYRLTTLLTNQNKVYSPPAARKPCLLCSLVLMVSRGKSEMSTAVPAKPPDINEVVKEGSDMIGSAMITDQSGVSN